MNELNVMTISTILELKLDIDDIAEALADCLYEAIADYETDYDAKELDLIEQNKDKILLAIAKTWIKNLE